MEHRRAIVLRPSSPRIQSLDQTFQLLFPTDHVILTQKPVSCHASDRDMTEVKDTPTDIAGCAAPASSWLGP